MGRQNNLDQSSGGERAVENGETNFLRHHGLKILVALLLAFVSGLVDIVGYMGVFHLFTAHLTGTTVQLGHELVTRQWDGVFAACLIVGGFVSGSILGRTVIEIGSRKRIHRIASLTLAIEASMLAFLAQGGQRIAARPHWVLVVLGACMGLQTATLTRIGPLTVHTTFVTGMVNKLAQLISHVAFRFYDFMRTEVRSTDAIRNQTADVQMSSFLAGVWLFYVGGAVFGTWSFDSWGMRGLLFATGLLAIGIATDQLSPLSIKEEKEQTED